MTSEPAFGIYDALIDKALQDVLNAYPELRAVFGKLEPEEQPARYADFIAKVMEQVLREEHDPAKRLALCNAILDKLASASAGSRLKSELTAARKSLLLEITPPHYGKPGIPRPHTPPYPKAAFLPGPPKTPAGSRTPGGNAVSRCGGHPGLLYQVVRPSPPDARFRGSQKPRCPFPGH